MMICFRIIMRNKKIPADFNKTQKDNLRRKSKFCNKRWPAGFQGQEECGFISKTIIGD